MEADELLYSAAFAVEKTAFKIETNDGDIFDLGANYTRDQIVHYAGLKGKVPKLDYKVQTYKITFAPVTYAIKCLKNTIGKLEKIGPVKLFLTSQDKSNFRYDIAKTEGPNGLGYKAGRAPRPIYYNQCRDYLLKRGAIEVEGMEADDALGIYQTDKTAVVHIDKDINRIAGKHLNWRTGERYVVTQPGELWLEEKSGKKKLRGFGNAYFFAQMLLGDRTDNIPSCSKGYGDVKVYNILSGCNTEMDYLEKVQEEFFKCHDEDCQRRLFEIADLTYIMDSAKIRGNRYIQDLLMGAIIKQSEELGY